ncbi:MAG TPA: hypothetical protein PLG15_04710 [Candidatus Gastranaerophilaceae bacterium]|nr:hypothetical protein [Candidatus Gastranaerophilaceae bacterium]HPT41668.1 hypothetical protein [Candidatus Gastranaerophilaceae bacterium]
MKKFLILLALIFGITATNADVMPYYVNNINSNSIGVYQASHEIKIYKEPNEKSPLLLSVTWDSKNFNSPDISASNLFVVFLPKKDLAFFLVTDENENWVQVIFNRNNSQTGWIKKDDELKFLNWRTFFNNYGRKYGVYYLKDAPEESKTIYSSSDNNGQVLGRIKLPEVIKLTTTKGNWILISVYDIEKIQKIGWIQWRNTNGEIHLFPAIK